MKWFWTVPILVAAFFTCLVIPLVICIYRTYVTFNTPENIPIYKPTVRYEPTEDQKENAIKLFSESLTFRTFSTQNNETAENELRRFVQFLEKRFPLVHTSQKVKVEHFKGVSLLYTAKGSDTRLKPYMIISHVDVVGVEQERWDYDPFGGTVKDGYVIGRGAMDAKHSLTAILQALECLLKADHNFSRTLIVAIEHDEESGGFDGARHIGRILEERGVQLEYIFDEGSLILTDLVPGVQRPVALISVAEKGQVTYELKVQGKPGHSSVPSKETVIVTLAKAISKFDSNVHPSYFGLGPEKDLFETVAASAKFPYNIMYSNLWLFRTLLFYLIGRVGVGVLDSLTRTTTAVTIINGGFKENVIPSTSSAFVNHRIHPKDNLKTVLRRDVQLVNDGRVKFEQTMGYEPLPISPHGSDSFGYMAIAMSIKSVYPQSVSPPGLLPGGTDSKWYRNLTNSIYRITPIYVKAEDTLLLHGNNEKISKENYLNLIRFYHNLMQISNTKSVSNATKR